MATHKLYEADKPEHCSRLESLPREVREKIYFYLGFPVAGHCVHYCDKPCSVHQALRFGQERKRHFEELKRQYEQKKENARWTSYNEGEITKFKEQARIALASNVVTISAIAKGQGLIPGKVSISGVDESRLEVSPETFPLWHGMYTHCLRAAQAVPDSGVWASARQSVLLRRPFRMLRGGFSYSSRGAEACTPAFLLGELLSLIG